MAINHTTSRLKNKVEESTRLTYTGLLVELEHLKIETTLINHTQRIILIWGITSLPFYSFRSSTCADTSCHVPLPPRGVLKFIEIESRQHPRQGCRFTCQLKYWWGVYHFKNSHSPVTLAGISFINVVSIFRCSSSTGNQCIRGV